MLQIRFISFFLVFISVNMLVISIISNKIKNRSILSFFGCLISILAITAIVFFPFPYQEELINDRILNGMNVSNNYVPFNTIVTAFINAIKHKAYVELVYSIIGNILLFVPLGYSLFFFIEGEKKQIRLFISISTVSLLIESLQWIFNQSLGFNYRSVDIDDLILNICGGDVGYIIARYLSEFNKISIKKQKKNKLQ